MEQTYEWTSRRDQYADAFRKLVSAAIDNAEPEAWYDHKFDFVIAPVQAVPALQHGSTTFLSPLAIWTILFNIVDSTVGVVPVTRVKAGLDQHDGSFLKGSDGSKLLEKRVYGGTKPAYDAQQMDGLPLGVQIVGQAWEEERVLKMMKIVEGLVHF